MHGYSVFTWKWGTVVCMYIVKELKLLYIRRIIKQLIFKRNNEIEGQGAGLDNTHGVITVFKKSRNKGQGKEMYYAENKIKK